MRLPLTPAGFFCSPPYRCSASHCCAVVLIYAWKSGNGGGSGLVGGLGNVGAYGLVLWAMTKAPVAVVAALRETSIVFATVFAIVVLRERADKARIVGALLIAAGAVAIRLA